jgi:death-on-curing protein
MDANKRTSLVVVELFLILNGCRLLAEDAECVAAMLSLAQGTISEAEFAAWIRARVGRYEQSAP